jgi:tripartite-type tricarboxylate transporter receptor subunit TctC
MRPLALMLVALCVLLSSLAFAQTWPDRPVRMLVPFPPGGGTDIQARVMTQSFQKSTGQNFVIDNRTGAGGVIAAQLGADAAPDGYTIFFTSAAFAVMPSLYGKRIKFDVLKDFAPISWISSTPLVLVTHPSTPAKTVPELIALAKSKVMTAAGNTAGSTSHLTLEMLKQTAGLQTTVLTYRGGGPAVIALISGEAEYAITTAPSIIPHVRSGKARVLAVTTAKPSSAFPDVPTMNKFFPGFEADNWYGMFFPKGTPRSLVMRMNSEIKKALDTPEMREFMPREALDPVGSTPEELAVQLKREVQKYAKVVKAANIRAD